MTKYSDGRRGNPKKRRGGFFALILLGLAVLLFGLIDIFGLDAEYFVLVVSLFAGLILLAILLMFSGKAKEAKEGAVFEGIESSHETELDYLRCKNCAHVFAFEMEHLKQARKPVPFSCPECGIVSTLPPTDDLKVDAVVPGGEIQEYAYICGNCDEHFAVGTIGHAPKRRVDFESCPHCGVEGQVRLQT